MSSIQHRFTVILYYSAEFCLFVAQRVDRHVGLLRQNAKTSGRKLFEAPCSCDALAPMRAATTDCCCDCGCCCCCCCRRGIFTSHLSPSCRGETRWTLESSLVSASASSATCTAYCLLPGFAAADTAVRRPVSDAYTSSTPRLHLQVFGVFRPNTT